MKREKQHWMQKFHCTEISKYINCNNAVITITHVCALHTHENKSKISLDAITSLYRKLKKYMEFGNAANTITEWECCINIPVQ